MDKASLVQRLKAAGVFDINRRHPIWHEAFEAHKAATGNSRSESCGPCYDKVRAWLLS